MNLTGTIEDLRRLSAEELAERAAQILPPWISLLLVIALAWQLAQMTWWFFPRPEPVSITPRTLPGGQGTVGPSAPVDTEAIQEFPFFGSYEKVTTPVVEIGPDVEETRLPLVLKGTVPTEVAQYAFAIIEADSEDKAYWIGDEVPGGASLSAIRDDQVILERIGTYESLKMKPWDERSPGAGRTTSRGIRNPGTSMRDLRNELVDNPSSFSDIVRPQPVFSQGQQVGYRVYPGRNRQRFVDIGLKPGDLVTAINGQTLDDPTRGAQIFRDIATASQIDITVERDGQPEVITVQLDQ